jgi:hypothetical protein
MLHRFLWAEARQGLPSIPVSIITPDKRDGVPGCFNGRLRTTSKLLLSIHLSIDSGIIRHPDG